MFKKILCTLKIKSITQKAQFFPCSLKIELLFPCLLRFPFYALVLKLKKKLKVICLLTTNLNGIEKKKKKTVDFNAGVLLGERK